MSEPWDILSPVICAPAYQDPGVPPNNFVPQRPTPLPLDMDVVTMQPAPPLPHDTPTVATPLPSDRPLPLPFDGNTDWRGAPKPLPSDTIQAAVVGPQLSPVAVVDTPSNLVTPNRQDDAMRKIKSKSAAIPLYNTVYVSASGGAVVQLLPAGSASPSGYIFVKTDATANTVTITAKTPDTIAGAATYVLSARYEAVALTWYGGVWYVQGFSVAASHTWGGVQTFPVGTLAAVFDACRVTHSAVQATASGTVTALTFDTEAYDNNNLHSTSVNPGRLTAQVAGLYRITGQAAFDNTGTGTIRSFQLRVNGTTMIAIQSYPPITGGVFATAGVVTSDYQLAATDYVEFRVLQDSGGSLNILSSASFSPIFSMSLFSR